MFEKQDLNTCPADFHACVAAFCEYYNVDEPVAAAFCAHTENAGFACLIKGYVEMARLNSQICAEYTACEAEAYRLVC
ncbi:hypothetical protein [Lacticaseibacillus zhaodongensis]|uniref:hypothetical protein n=1 Tax=Lacticaseibacillus zhaodongensis TaxID=2668065 RepID=UPI0012D32EF8|nr:hypothetical protein [Lacticaseibacillus zhaodongensis]